ncbi:SDR family oxidoreductase [Dongia sedimenti]|uniref:SDR family oxidoreductase n=1 Tax=Dongia sedimenti TaxID=3064282 RepID=A0ABU0YVM8_9PROT|nr:SDR family oxidoreductase [Rhodospirillaceae bacterium R-7]
MDKGTNGKTILVLGGTSDIGRATARHFAARGWRIQLAGRDPEALQRDADDIASRSRVAVTVHAFDVLDSTAMAPFIDGLPLLPDIVVCVVGLHGNQARAQSDLDHATAILRSNFEGPALILGLFAEHFARRGSGMIVGVTSVAGDRGRASNYVYGSAKAGFSAYLSGLRNRLAKQDIHVITVKPGFVRTRMTDGMKLPGPLTAAPEEVASAIWRAADRKSDQIYVRRIWAVIMLGIRAIPEAIFKRLSI